MRKKKIVTKGELREVIEMQAHKIDKMGEQIKHLRQQGVNDDKVIEAQGKKIVEAQSINYQANGLKALLKTYLVSVTRSKDKYVIESFNVEVLDYLMDG